MFHYSNVAQYFAIYLVNKSMFMKLCENKLFLYLHNKYIPIDYFINIFYINKLKKTLK